MAQCDTQSLLNQAACFSCLPTGQLQMIELQLLCEILAAAGGGNLGFQQVYQNSGNPNGVVTPNTTKPCLCVDTLNAVIWQKSDGLLTNTGWASP